ncbi:uncharacterized protein LOC135924199 [Gordionus sp. m RMFG-2023]|uniref:uncharacterized protein LOC135924199 n=1 Tax=Gordionus sp. m RMFG-2023 TaxID=3053472 RepID=UPI0031FD2BCB
MLTNKLLMRPPFKFIQDIVKEINMRYKVFDNIYTAKDYDSKTNKSKAEKLEFLNKLIDFANKESHSKLKTTALKMVAGLEPESTNALLQTFGKIIEKKKKITQADARSRTSSIQNSNTNPIYTPFKTTNLTPLPRKISGISPKNSIETIKQLTSPNTIKSAPKNIVRSHLKTNKVKKQENKCKNEKFEILTAIQIGNEVDKKTTYNTPVQELSIAKNKKGDIEVSDRSKNVLETIKNPYIIPTVVKAKEKNLQDILSSSGIALQRSKELSNEIMIDKITSIWQSLEPLNTLLVRLEKDYSFLTEELSSWRIKRQESDTSLAKARQNYSNYQDEIKAILNDISKIDKRNNEFEVQINLENFAMRMNKENTSI